MRQRAAVLKQAAAIMRGKSDQLAQYVTLEMGKLWNEAKGEVELSADILDINLHGLPLRACCLAT